MHAVASLLTNFLAYFVQNLVYICYLKYFFKGSGFLDGRVGRFIGGIFNQLGLGQNNDNNNQGDSQQSKQRG